MERVEPSLHLHRLTYERVSTVEPSKITVTEAPPEVISRDNPRSCTPQNPWTDVRAHASAVEPGMRKQLRKSSSGKIRERLPPAQTRKLLAAGWSHRGPGAFYQRKQYKARATAHSNGLVLCCCEMWACGSAKNTRSLSCHVERCPLGHKIFQ